ncbi:MAG: hypothetical protein HOQ05_01385 [Corynebacteriales bacterium]|nr:hypothetical protein [Mycobacteriales bacterium]
MTDVAVICRALIQNAARLGEIGEELRREADKVDWTYQLAAEHFIAQSCHLADDIRRYGEFAARAAQSYTQIHETVGV